jgi:hypothetical protein
MCHIRNNFVAYCVCDFLVLKLHQENVWPVKNFNWKLLATEKKIVQKSMTSQTLAHFFPI